ncbi:hypothetical protein [Amphiplicatus metriothermophilus]|uniref:MORN repeat variant n=1 Tax=Amphiplicatus metriothermophilus TaxID=1519374 RepID=A0A239PYM6_9PROT|nr:hypothetical protein [Amphiplicatus metriothermophilus]MBB5518191.1 hypothetical protein [Amphiplicatus metriothermophilus]SNT75354.1 hypothetical protein SAMN06297382_2695 [Amphiplicatus metriothermophilus]
MRNAFAAALCLLAAPAAAQSAAGPCAEEAYRAFDFWIGEWEVFNRAGEKAGDNSIVAEEDGCLLVERWTGARGGTGQSYNYYDPTTQKWRQIWVSAGFVIDYEGGLNAKGEMVLEGTIAYRDGRTAPFRGTWTPLENGDVRQFFEQRDAETGAWREWFTGVYKLKSAGAH